MMGLLISLSEKKIILTQDAVYALDNYYPKCMIPGLIDDETSYLKLLKKVRCLQEKYNAYITFGHDSTQRKILQMAPAYYE